MMRMFLFTVLAASVASAADVAVDWDQSVGPFGSSPNVESKGTPHQAALIAAALIDHQNSSCGKAASADIRGGSVVGSPLSDPMVRGLRNAYFASVSFNLLRNLGTAVRATSSDTAVRVVAARKGVRGAIMLANCSDREIPLTFRVDGLQPVSWSITSPTMLDVYTPGKPPKTIPSDSFIVVFFNEDPPTWGKPKTTRRYLQGPRSSRLAVLFREGKLLLGDCVHEHDWQKIPYSTVVSHGLWLVHGEKDVPFDFRKATLSKRDDAVPICSQVWREGDLELEMEACAPFGREPNAHLRVRVTNRGAEPQMDTLSFLLRRGPEKDLVQGAPDGYVAYDPQIADWMKLRSQWKPAEESVIRDGEAFVSFSENVGQKWDAQTSSVRVPVSLAPGASRTIDCVVGNGRLERPHYDEVRVGVQADWRKELSRVEGRSALIRNLTVQMLQCFSRPTKGDYILPRQGGLQRWVWPGDQRAVSAALDRLGYYEYVEQAVDFYFGQYLQPDGEVGKFGNGWANDTASCLTIFSRHALASGDAAFWKRWRDAAAKAFGWIRDTREKDGLFPPLKSADSESVFRNWGGTDCTNLEAVELFARAAAKFGDPLADEAAKVAVDYRAAIGRFLDRWRQAAKGKDEFFIPFAPDAANEEEFSQHFYYSHPGNFAKAGFLDEDELTRVRNWMVRTGVANAERGLYMISRDGEPGRGAEGNFWYMTWAEHHWFRAWMRVGRRDLAQQALDACLRYAVSDEYMIGERYHAANPWLFPWSPNASGSGRIIQMLLDLEGEK